MTRLIVHMEGGDATSAARRRHQRIPATNLFKKVAADGASVEVALGTNTAKTIENFTVGRSANSGRAEVRVLLLVDSDGNVTTDPVSHLVGTKQYTKLPGDTPVDDVHLMVHAMETWLVADPAGLKKMFRTLAVDRLPNVNLEQRDRSDIIRALKRALGTKPYDKGNGLAALEHLNPETIAGACPSAKRFFERLMSAG